jgi:predicted secreted protein
MKRAILAQMALALAVTAWAGDKPKDRQTEQAVSKVGGVSSPARAEIAVGEVYAITLPCNPTTGYNWELKSIDRKIAVPTGPVEFQESPAKPGMVGVGGNCVLGIKGVKPGKTKAVLVYRRAWEKKKPAKTFQVEITVTAKK